MFSVTKTELKLFPLCTKNVWPTKSGVTIERRDHVLIGFFTPERFILSTFSGGCTSTKGPFFTVLAIILNEKVTDRDLASWPRNVQPTCNCPPLFGLSLSKTLD